MPPGEEKEHGIMPVSNCIFTGGLSMSIRTGFLLSLQRRFRPSILLISTALIMAACGSSSAAKGSVTTSSAPASPYTFHAILSLTGAGATLGSAPTQALTAFAAYENSQGGIDGHPIKVDIADNQSTPSTAVAEATSLIHSGVPFILNGSISSADNAVDALAGSQGPVIYDLSPVAHPAAGSYVFAPGISTTYLEAAIANFMKVSSYSRIAIINTVDASGLAGYNDLEEALKNPTAAGLTVVAHQTYEPNAVSVTPQLSVIKAANPQAIFVSTTGTPFGTVLRGMKSLGMQSIPTFATSGNALQSALENFSSVVPAHLYMPLGPLYFSPQSLPASMRSFMTRFDGVVKAAGAEPNTGWGLPVDAFLLVVRALRALGVNATAPQLKNYLETKVKSVPGSFGLYSMSVSNHVGTNGNDVWIGEWTGTSFEIVSGEYGTSVVNHVSAAPSK